MRRDLILLMLVIGAMCCWLARRPSETSRVQQRLRQTLAATTMFPSARVKCSDLRRSPTRPPDLLIRMELNISSRESDWWTANLKELVSYVGAQCKVDRTMLLEVHDSVTHQELIACTTVYSRRMHRQDTPYKSAFRLCHQVERRLQAVTGADLALVQHWPKAMGRVVTIVVEPRAGEHLAAVTDGLTEIQQTLSGYEGHNGLAVGVPGGFVWEGLPSKFPLQDFQQSLLLELKSATRESVNEPFRTR